MFADLSGKCGDVDVDVDCDVDDGRGRSEAVRLD
jgi:hypothetical protein